jgi:hypothetical protein
MPEERLMFLVALVVVGSVCGAFALAVVHAEAVSAWWRARWEALRSQRLRGRGWGWLLLPLALVYALIAGSDHLLAAGEILLAALVLIFAPRLAAKSVPYATLALGCYGLGLAKTYHDGNTNQVLYGLVLAGAGSWRTHLVLAQAAVFFAAGLWLLVRVQAPGAGLVRALIARWRSSARRGILPVQGLLLLPVVALAMGLLGFRDWFGAQWVTPAGAIAADVVVAAASLVLVFRSRSGPRPWPRRACSCWAPTAS